MLFEWDERKAKANSRKHGVSFEVAARVFEDPCILTMFDSRFEEERWIAIGRVERKVVYVAYKVTDEEKESETIRLISAREATSHECGSYQADPKDACRNQ